MRQRVDVAHAGPGWITHGHLYGHRAFVVDMLEDGPGDRPTYHEVADRLRRSGLLRLHIVSPPGDAHLAYSLCQYLTGLVQGVTPTLAYRAGDYLDSDPLVYESVLVVRPGDDLVRLRLDRRAGSVSVHGWCGGETLRTVDDECEAPYGQYLVLPPSDVGEAKTWLSQQREGRWQLLPAHDFDTVEPAEMERHMGSAHG